MSRFYDAARAAAATATSASTVKHQVKAGEALTKGQAVYVTGSTGNSGTNMIVGKASNASESTSSKTMGLIASTLSTNDIDYVITEGLLEGLDTSTASAGDPVWLGTNGNLIYGLANKPVAPAHLVFIGIVTRAQQNNGEIFVKVQNGFELGELHDVLLTSPANNSVLAYNSASGLWIDNDGFLMNSASSTIIAAIVDSAPATLDTLNELAAALNDDANFSTTVTNSLATKAPLESPALTGTPTAPTASVLTNTTQIATTAFVNAEIANDTVLKTGGSFTGTVTGVSPTAAGSSGFRNITMSTSAPTGGSDGDVWLVYA